MKSSETDTHWLPEERKAVAPNLSLVKARETCFLSHGQMLKPRRFKYTYLLNQASRGACLTQPVEHATLDLRVMSSNPMLGHRAYFKKTLSAQMESEPSSQENEGLYEQGSGSRGCGVGGRKQCNELRQVRSALGGSWTLPSF